nr:1-deoxy-D-xylulose-5-phosphate synthase N-terminal domain-containing protein [Spirochaetota bacterium]
GYQIIDNRIFVLVGDGDLMEGLSYEACSIAGHLKLNNLVVIYDSNKISIEGSTDITFTEDVAKRFDAFGWNAIRANGHDFEDQKKDLTKRKKVGLMKTNLR